MLTPSRQLYTENTQADLRSLFDHCRRHLENLQLWLAGHPQGLEPSAQVVGEVIGQAIEKTSAEHARLDLDLLVEAVGAWEHPVQVICRPRAPFGNVAEACAQRLEKAEGPEIERLRQVYQRVERAHLIDASARRRRAARQQTTCCPDDLGSA